MGTFYTTCSVESVADRKKSATVPGMLVDTDSEYTWVPAKTLESIGVSREKKDITRVDSQQKKLVAAGPVPAAPLRL